MNRFKQKIQFKRKMSAQWSKYKIQQQEVRRKKKNNVINAMSGLYAAPTDNKSKHIRIG